MKYARIARGGESAFVQAWCGNRVGVPLGDRVECAGEGRCARLRDAQAGTTFRIIGCRAGNFRDRPAAAPGRGTESPTG